MGRKSEVIDLTKVEKTELQNGYKYSKLPNFSRRCHIVSLKNQGITFQEIADIFGITRPPVHNWCNSYLEKGITGLKTKKDQGRKFILDKTKDESIMKVTVQKERQRLENAEEILEEELDKSFSVKTLQRF